MWMRSYFADLSSSPTLIKQILQTLCTWKAHFLLQSKPLASTSILHACPPSLCPQDGNPAWFQGKTEGRDRRNIRLPIFWKNEFIPNLVTLYHLQIAIVSCSFRGRDSNGSLTFSWGCRQLEISSCKKVISGSIWIWGWILWPGFLPPGCHQISSSQVTSLRKCRCLPCRWRDMLLDRTVSLSHALYLLLASGEQIRARHLACFLSSHIASGQSTPFSGKTIPLTTKPHFLLFLLVSWTPDYWKMPPFRNLVF